MEIPKNFVIRFSEGQEANLEFVDHKDGVSMYETSFTDSEGLKEGEKIVLTMTVKCSFLTETEKLFYNVVQK